MVDTLPDHGSRAHSRLGASIAHRWLACPGSVRMSYGIEDRQTVFAAEGSAAHELAEMCLRANFAPALDYLGEEIVVGNHKFEVTEEMAEAVQLYVDTVRALYDPGDILFIEHKFDLTSVYDGMFGTNDCGIYKVDGRVIVLDYKHGAGHAVEATENPQLMYYGIGLLSIPSLRGAKVTQVELVIVQPRAPHKDGPVRSWTTDPLTLLDFAGELREGAVATTNPDAPLAAGDHCKFCPAAGICPALREIAITRAQDEFVDVVAPDLTDEDISVLLEKCSLIEDGIRAIRAEAFNRAQGGAKIPGWKLVAKRAMRKWAGEPDIVKGRLAFDFGLSPDQILEEKLRSPAQIEKLLKGDDKKALADLVVAESSGVTLARETDRRAEARPQRDAAADFDPVE